MVTGNLNLIAFSRRSTELVFDGDLATPYSYWDRLWKNPLESTVESFVLILLLKS